MKNENDILIKNVNIWSDDIKHILINVRGYRTVGDLAKENVDEIKRLLGSKSDDFITIRNHLHSLGLCFSDEYDQIGLPIDIANMGIYKLDLPESFKHILNRNKIFTVGELLTTDYNDICRMRNVGNKHMIKLKEVVHDMGYTLLNEGKSIYEIREEAKESGVQLLEEIFTNVRIYSIFYHYGIYTIDDLKKYDSDIVTRIGFGPKTREEIYGILDKLNIKLNDSQDKTVTDNSFENSNNQKKECFSVESGKCLDKTNIKIMIDENKRIESRIDRKKAQLEEFKILVNEYNILLEKKEELLKREAELDALLAEKVKLMKAGIALVKSRKWM